MAGLPRAALDPTAIAELIGSDDNAAGA